MRRLAGIGFLGAVAFASFWKLSHRPQRALVQPAVVQRTQATTTEHDAVAVLPPPPSPIPAPPDCAAPPMSAARLPSGIAWRRLHDGNDKSDPKRDGNGSPRPNDVVTLEYDVWKRDGSLVDSTRQNGQPLVQSVRTLALALQTSVQDMRAGEERLLWLPENSPVGPDTQISAFPITLQLALKSFRRAPATPERLESAPPHAKRTPSGLAYELLASPTHAAQPSAESQVEILHTVWSSDGAIVESTELAEHPALYIQADLLPGLREGVRLLHVGDKARFWLPARLAYGDHARRGRPKGPLVADVKLISIH